MLLETIVGLNWLFAVRNAGTAIKLLHIRSPSTIMNFLLEYLKLDFCILFLILSGELMKIPALGTWPKAFLRHVMQ